MKPPLNDGLLSATASKTSRSDRPYFSSRGGSTTTWNCRVRPPHELISLTPGTERSRVRISQSWMVLGSIGVDGVAGDHVLVDLAEGRGHRAERRLEAQREASAHVAQSAR